MFINHSSIMRCKQRALLFLSLLSSQASCSSPCCVLQGRVEAVLIWLSGSAQMPPSSFQHSQLPLVTVPNASPQAATSFLPSLRFTYFPPQATAAKQDFPHEQAKSEPTSLAHTKDVFNLPFTP